MRKARAAATAASKPKPKLKPRSRAAPKAKPSPASLLSGGSSLSAGGGGASSPAAAGLSSFLSDSPSRSPEKPRARRSPLASPAASPIPAPAAMSTIGDLRSLAASHLDSLKRRLDGLHAESVRDLEASHSRLSKRVKMQTHGCVQLADEADKEHKKVADKITERTEVVKNSYRKFMAEVQASTSRVCKVTVTEMAKSAERAIDGLRRRYNISATPA